MRFHTQHRFQGSEEAVAAVLTEPTFHLGLTLPDLSRPEVLEDRSDGDVAVLRLRYEFTGKLDPIAQRLLGTHRLTWIQEVRVDAQASSGSLRFAVEKDPGRLHGAADFVLAPSGGDTIRRLEGELVVAVPGIGRTAERRIVPGLVRRLDIEAQALNEQLQRGR